MNLFRIKTEKYRADNLFVHNMDDCGAKVKLSIRFINILGNIFIKLFDFHMKTL